MVLYFEKKMEYLRIYNIIGNNTIGLSSCTFTNIVLDIKYNTIEENFMLAPDSNIPALTLDISN